MWYLILFSNLAKTADEEYISIETRKNVRQAHLARCAVLEKEDRLLLGGPFPRIDSDNPSDWEKAGGYSGGMIIVQFNDLFAAEQWAKEDPYVISGVFAGPVVVKPWFQTVGKGVEFGRGW